MDLNNPTKVPSLPELPASSDDPLVRQILEMMGVVKEVFDIKHGTATNADVLDANPTWRDLYHAGTVNIQQNGIVYSSSDASQKVLTFPPATTTGGDTSTPPAPSGFTATQSLTSIYLNWDASTRENHAYTEIWTNTVSDLATAKVLGSTPGHFFADAVGTTTTTHYYWIRFVSTSNIFGAFSSMASAATGKIGNADITDLVLTANKMASNILASGDVSRIFQANSIVSGMSIIGVAAITNAMISSLTADKINTGTLNAGVVSVTNLNASNITTGSLAAARLDANTVYVNTLQIANQAVTVPVSDYTAGDIELTTGFSSVASTPFTDFTNSKVFIIFSAIGTTSGNSVKPRIQIQIKRDGSVIFGPFYMFTAGHGESTTAFDIHSSGVVTFSETPPSGGHSYSVEALYTVKDPIPTVTLGARSLLVLGAKR